MATQPLHTLGHRVAALRGGTPLPILLILGCIALLAVLVPALIVATTPRVVVHKMPRVIISKRVVPKTELPPVEPVTLQEVAATDAKAINAAIPFSTLPNPAARAFQIFGASDSQARAVDCLAAALYYEAGDDAVGERAVAQVIINRMKHPAFPKTICGVVFQGSERSTGCQFTFTCDGAILRYGPSAAAWQRSRDIARMALNGSVYAAVGHATHYHTDWVVPYWSASLEKITEVHTHLFFRWAGWWGTPGAFTRGYAGAEPNVPQMSRLSAAHHGDPNAPLLLPGMAPGDAMIVDPDSIKAADVPAAMPADANSFLVTLPRGMSADSFASLAIRTCGERPYCKFMAWADAGKTPARLPLSSVQVAAMSFSYLRDETQGFAKALWNCDQFRRPSPVQCMRAQPLAKPPVEAAPVGADGKPVGPGGLPGVRRKEPAAPPVSGKPAVTFTMPAPKPTPTPAPRP
jgi:spore germination cell wall hydrolase CwlJ-like protein